MKSIYKVKGLEAKGHYSLASEHNGTIYISGQLSFDVNTGEVKLGTIQEEVQQVLEIFEHILAEYDCDRNDIIKTTVIISDIADWPKVNEAYSEFFGDHRPARIVIPCRELNYGLKVEIEGIAVKK